MHCYRPLPCSECVHKVICWSLRLPVREGRPVRVPVPQWTARPCAQACRLCRSCCVPCVTRTSCSTAAGLMGDWTHAVSGRLQSSPSKSGPVLLSHSAENMAGVSPSMASHHCNQVQIQHWRSVNFLCLPLVSLPSHQLEKSPLSLVLPHVGFVYVTS